MLRRSFLTLVASAAAISSFGCGGLVRAARDFELTSEWKDYDQVVIHSHNGRVELSTSDSGSIRISGSKYVRGNTLEEAERNLDKLEIVAESRSSDAKVFAIEVRFPDELRRCSPGAELKVLVPRACRAEIKTSNGSIRAGNMRDEVSLASSNGAVTIEGAKGRVRAETSNGTVTARNVDGDLTASTSNGAIVVRGVSGKCELETSNGSVEAIEVRGSLSVVSSNGGIRVDAAPPVDGSVVLTTSNSSIEATVPAAMKGEVNLRTSNGRVRTNLREAVLNVTEQSKSRLQALLNGGGQGRIVASSSNGSVTLTCR